MTPTTCQCDRENDLSATQTAESECPKHGTQPPGEQRWTIAVCANDDCSYEVGPPPARIRRCSRCEGPLERIEVIPASHTSALQAEQVEFLRRIRAIARDSGYAIAVHGSQERDLDLIAAPWIVDAAEPSELVKRVCDELTLWPNPESPSPNPEAKPHGRLSWALIGSLPESWSYVDLSVAPWQPPAQWSSTQQPRAVKRVDQQEHIRHGLQVVLSFGSLEDADAAAQFFKDVADG